MTTNKPRVFISYSSKDKHIARNLAEVLQVAGAAAWPDTDAIPSAHWLDDIQRAMQEADVFVFLMSPDALKSQWVNVEIGAALNLSAEQGKALLIPVMIRDVDLPLLLRPFQFLDARRMSVDELGKRLIELIETTQTRESRGKKSKKH